MLVVVDVISSQHVSRLTRVVQPLDVKHVASGLSTCVAAGQMLEEHPSYMHSISWVAPAT